MADRYFTYDPCGDGFETHPTAEAAEAHVRAILDEERSDAWDGWNEDRVATLRWGEIRGRVVETSRKEVPPGVTLDEDDQGSDGEDYSDIPHGCDALVNYAILSPPAPAVPTPSAALVVARRAHDLAVEHYGCRGGFTYFARLRDAIEILGDEIARREAAEARAARPEEAPCERAERERDDTLTAMARCLPPAQPVAPPPVLTPAGPPEAEEEAPRLRAALAEAERAAFVEATGAANDLSERGAHQEQAAGSILRQIQAIRLRVDPVYAASLEGRCALRAEVDRLQAKITATRAEEGER